MVCKISVLRMVCCKRDGKQFALLNYYTDLALLGARQHWQLRQQWHHHGHFPQHFRDASRAISASIPASTKKSHSCEPFQFAMAQWFIVHPPSQLDGVSFLPDIKKKHI
jgi:hypothetical protein